MSHTQASKPKLSLQDRIALHALRLKEDAQTLRPGPERDDMIRRAQQAETATHMVDWLSSPALRPKKC